MRFGDGASRPPLRGSVYLLTDASDIAFPSFDYPSRAFLSGQNRRKHQEYFVAAELVALHRVAFRAQQGRGQLPTKREDESLSRNKSFIKSDT